MDRVTHSENLDQCALTEAAKVAVFTVSQTKEIIRLDKLYNEILRNEIQELRQRLRDVICKADLDRVEESVRILRNLIEQGPKMAAEIEDLHKHVSCLERDIEEVKSFDSKVTSSIGILRDGVSNLQKEVNTVECEVMKQNRVIVEIKEKTEKSDLLNKAQTDKILSVDSELHSLEKKVASLDSRIEMMAPKKEIIDRLICLERKKYQDERVEKILEILKTFESMRESVRENSKMKAKIEALEESNRVQNCVIQEIRNKNIEQDRQISCLNEKLNRTALLLDGKVENVEKQVLDEERHDLNQTTAIKLLQTQIEELKKDMHLLTAKAYTHSC